MHAMRVKSIAYSKGKLILFIIAFMLLSFAIKYLRNGNTIPTRYLSEKFDYDTSYYQRRHNGKSSAQNQQGMVDKNVLFFNRIPKTGSEMTVLLMQWLRGENVFMHYRLKNTVNHYLSRKEQKMLTQEIDERARNSKETHVSFDRHVHFVNFLQFDKKMPLYFSIVRDPIEKIISQFYSVRVTPPPGDVIPANYKYPESKKYAVIEQCLEARHAECAFRYGDKYDLNIPYFCGQEGFCRELNNILAMETAKQNVEKWYPVVGVLEMFNTSLLMYEKLLPSFFSGVTELYNNDLKAIHYNKNREKPAVRKWVKDRLKQNLTLEIQFYNYLFERLKKQHEQYNMLSL